MNRAQHAARSTRCPVGDGFNPHSDDGAFEFDLLAVAIEPGLCAGAAAVDLVIARPNGENTGRRVALGFQNVACKHEHCRSFLRTAERRQNEYQGGLHNNPQYTVHAC